MFKRIPNKTAQSTQTTESFSRPAKVAASALGVIGLSGVGLMFASGLNLHDILNVSYPGENTSAPVTAINQRFSGCENVDPHKSQILQIAVGQETLIPTSILLGDSLKVLPTAAACDVEAYIEDIILPMNPGLQADESYVAISGIRISHGMLNLELPIAVAAHPAS